MGCAASLNDVNSRSAAKKSKEIEKQLKEDSLKAAKVVKLLLLGAGECGKSTIVKQMKIIHAQGYTKVERLTYKSAIIQNTLQAFVAVIEAMKILKLDFQQNVSIEDICTVLSIDQSASFDLRPEKVSLLKNIWKDPGVQQCFSRSREYQLSDSGEYYLNHLSNIFKSDYIPDEQDILRIRIRTTGIVESQFLYKGLSFRMFDVGGQRAERKKWIHCFEDVTSIIFVASLNDYDLVTAEDHITNRMVESMNLFQSICNSKWFKETSMILFLNKKDLFHKKINFVPISICFPEYSGGCTYNETSRYIQSRFERLIEKKSNRNIYSHFTCATDTGNVQFVFDAVTDVLIQHNLKDIGLF